MKVTVKEHIRRIDIQISMTHHIQDMKNEWYIYTKVKLFYYPYGTFAHAYCPSSVDHKHEHLLVKSKEQVRQCAISRGRCFSFVRTIRSRKLMHTHRKKGSSKVQPCCGASERVVPHTCSAYRQAKRERNVGPKFYKLHISLQLHNSSIL